MQIEIKIEEKYKEPKIIVMTDKMTDEVNAIIKRLSDEQPQVIAGFREDMVEVLEPSEIYRVFAESGKVFAETDHGEYALRGYMRRNNGLTARFLSEYQTRILSI